MTGKPGHILDNNLSNKINKKDTKIKFLFEINTVLAHFITRLQTEAPVSGAKSIGKSA
jgi:hypothetical protein